MKEEVGWEGKQDVVGYRKTIALIPFFSVSLYKNLLDLWSSCTHATFISISLRVDIAMQFTLANLGCWQTGWEWHFEWFCILRFAALSLCYHHLNMLAHWKKALQSCTAKRIGIASRETQVHHCKSLDVICHHPYPSYPRILSFCRI